MSAVLSRLLLRGLALAAVVVGGSLWCVSGSAVAAEGIAWWSISSGARPTVLPAKGEGQVVVQAENLGDAPTSGKVTVTDVLPAGFTAVGIKAVAGGPAGFARGPVACKLETLTCTFTETAPGNGVLPPYETIEVQIAVQVGKAKSGGLNEATVSGGGAAHPVSATHPISVGGAGTFGVDDYSLAFEQLGGLADIQAGSHPFQVTTSVTFNSQTPDMEGRPRTFALPKQAIAELPAGFIGNPTPFAQCTDAQFGQNVKELGHGAAQPINACPAESAIGVATLTFNEPKVIGFGTITAPIFNMVPRAGEPARFGFKAAGKVAAFLDTSIRSGGDYGVTVSAFNIPEIAWVLGVKLTFWGVPGAAAHNAQRGWECLQELGEPGACPSGSAKSPPPFLVMPSSCGRPVETTLRSEAWGASGQPGEVGAPFTYRVPGEIDGCNRLPFAPEISVTPDGSSASSPSGLDVDVHVPQDAILNAESLSEAAVKKIAVTLPQGVVINPAGADGLASCSESEVGYLPPAQGNQLFFTPSISQPFCPDASKVATVRISSPLLPKGQDVTGAAYIASQNQNPFGSLLAMYIVAEDPISGAVVKLAGEVHLTEAGQIVTTFKDSPQLAFEDAELHFFGGERAPLGTPAHCNSYTTIAEFTPWSSEEAVTATSTFAITEGPHGTPCPGAKLPFAPTLTAGTTNIQAGAFTPLTTTINRKDGDQDLGSVSLLMPPGVSGDLAGVALCAEQQANEGTCPPASQIGETTVSAGLGADPVSVTGGRVYMTETYAGAPFGLSIVNPVKAGPFDLERDSANPNNDPACDCIVVRAKVEIDPHTAQLTVTTDHEGPHAIPNIIDGIPVQIQHVNVVINRPGFTFNPTDCSPLAIGGSITSNENAAQPVSVPFQVTNCATLGFKPDFKASTSGHTSRVNGASLTVKLAYPKAALGSQTNIARVKVELPKQLPSRLTTLQKACLAVTFEANPSSCPAHSLVGHAKVNTPILPVPLEGPAYFVSHGGAAFPDLIVVLHGYGITVDLVGTTLIKKGVTSSTFKTAPDVPFNTFELTLPEGPYSALATTVSLCKAKLSMPTEFVAQNGTTLHQATKIAATGCPKAKHAKPRAKRGKKRH